MAAPLQLAVLDLVRRARLSVRIVAAAAVGFAVAPTRAAGPAPTNESWWSLQTLVRPSVPPGPAHPVDAFLEARLAARGLSPAPPAERRVLARRLFHDLIGLPPTPAQVAEFVSDPDPRAWERLVDRLLAEPAHGERWARHWLDLVAYADTHGNDHDYARPNAWPYRDYVIAAFNRDKPYPRFIEEQIAGDVLYPEDPDATVALGFLAAGPWDETLMVGVREDTVDHRVARNLDRDNFVGTAIGTLQSVTIQCARCHPHKFDPISQREYYGLQAVFAGIDRADRPFDPDPATHGRRRDLLARRVAIANRDPAVPGAPGTPEAAAVVSAAREALARRDQDWARLKIVSAVSVKAPDGTTFEHLPDESWRVSGTRPEQDTFVLTAPVDSREIRALRLEVLPDPSLPQGGPGRFDNGNFHLSEIRALARPVDGASAGAVRWIFRRAFADHADGTDAVTNAIDGKDATFWSVHPRYGEAHEAVFELAEPARGGAGMALTVLLEFNGKTGHQAGRFRLSVAAGDVPTGRLPPAPAGLSTFLRREVATLTDAEQVDLGWRCLADRVDRELAVLPEPRQVYAVTRHFTPQGSFKPSASPRPIHLLLRGEIDRPGEPVGPGTLRCIPGLAGELAVSETGDESLRRAALARWLADRNNVLTWRSVVNRVWQHHFGRGLCETPSDFGRMGDVPEHRELLDWLAVWFRDEAHGSMKALHRLLVTSAAYRRSCDPPPGATERDAGNRLLSHANRVRLSAEEIRDAVLLMSGRIDRTYGGPPVVQFVSRGRETFRPDGGAPPFLDYEAFDADAPENRRRSIYRFVFRTVPDPFFDALDCPDGAAPVPVRHTSTTALQALAMLNNGFLIRQCEHLATRLSTEATTPEQQAYAAFEHVLLRRPTASERARFAAYIARHGLANACHLLVNGNEFLHLE